MNESDPKNQKNILEAATQDEAVDMFIAESQDLAEFNQDQPISNPRYSESESDQDLPPAEYLILLGSETMTAFLKIKGQTDETLIKSFQDFAENYFKTEDFIGLKTAYKLVKSGEKTALQSYLNKLYQTIVTEYNRATFPAQSHGERIGLDPTPERHENPEDKTRRKMRKNFAEQAARAAGTGYANPRWGKRFEDVTGQHTHQVYRGRKRNPNKAE